MTALKICPVCGKEFKPLKCNQVVCSEKCRKEYRRNYHKAYHAGHLNDFKDYYRSYYLSAEVQRCMQKHGNCYECPTENGDCLFD